MLSSMRLDLLPSMNPDGFAAKARNNRCACST